MPSLTNHQSARIVKLLALGDAKVGKTTSLASLVKDYDLRILDLDNLLDPLVAMIKKLHPDRLGSLDVRTLRDKRKMTDAGPIIDGAPKAFIDTIKMLDKWKYTDGGETIDLGTPSTWGPKCILVIDSLSRLCDAAYDWCFALAPPKTDGRAIYGEAQDAVESLLAGITSKTFDTNVIVICHGTFINLPDGTTKIFPQGVGQKLSPKIPQYFPNYIRYKNVANRRTLQLKSDINIDLATPANVPDTYPADTGLAQLFKDLLGAANPTPKPKLIKA